MSLILDHINGVHDDNRFENLRIVCPNCAATLDTHCGSNRRTVAVEIECPICGTRFLRKYRTHRYCSRECGQRVANRGPRPERRKVPRPSYEQLIAEVRADGFAATGRRYGVTDNAIRKWIIAMERERAGD